MLKRILVVLDGSESARAAKQYALTLAQRMKAQLTGAAIIDTPWITAAQTEPLGGAAYKIHSDRTVIKKTRERIRTLLKNFSEQCTAQDIRFEIRELEGFPATEIETLSQEHDLIVIGKTTDFHLNLDKDTDLTVKHIAHDNPRPLVVVTDKEVTSDTVLIAYDGSLQSARALHMYLLLGIGHGKKHRILSICRRQDEAECIAQRAANLCVHHGLEITTEGVATLRAPEKVILEKVEEHKASLIVMGAYGEQSLKEIFFGSCTEHVMEKTRVPLFIHR